MKNAKTIKNTSPEHQELLITAIMDFYSKHPGYKMSQSECIGLICTISQQMLKDN